MTHGCERRQFSGKILGQAVFGCFAVMLLAAGCNSAPAPADTKAAEDAVRTADAAWSNAAVAMNVPAVGSYYADDAIMLPPNMGIVRGKDAAQKAWATMLVPGNSTSWTSSTVVASASGDMVYDQGTYTASIKGPDGRAVSDTGKYLCVWKKQADGSWKVEADMFNSDLPAKGK
jgi:ketosteroid isomerase-like protein